MQIKFAIPSKINKIERIEGKPALDTKQFDEGFHAGYQAGKWQAALEQKKWVDTQKEEWKKSLQALTSLHQESRTLIASDFPQLIQLITDKLLKKNPFTHQQIAEEIQSLLRDLSEAQSIRIECSPLDLESIQNICEKTGMILGQGTILWKSNHDLTAGEYRIHSDLGSIDGRLQLKLAKLKLALDQS